MIASSTKKELKKQCHSLNPVVLIGANGLTEAVLKEIDVHLTAHELIKIRLNAHEKDVKTSMINTITDTLNAELIQAIGHTAAFYREKQED